MGVRAMMGPWERGGWVRDGGREIGGGLSTQRVAARQVFLQAIRKIYAGTDAWMQAVPFGLH